MNPCDKGHDMTDHATHTDHPHVHADGCGHVAVSHDGHTDYLHDAHLHHAHEDHVDEHQIAVGVGNPADCTGGADDIEPGHSHGTGCGHEAVPHDGHTDYLHNAHLHHVHEDHVDEHGQLTVA